MVATIPAWFPQLLAKGVIDKLVGTKKNPQTALRRELQEAIDAALVEEHRRGRWSGENHASIVPGLPAQTETIALTYQAIPRRMSVGAGRVLDESDLYAGDRHYAVLGDPGAEWT